MKTILITGGAGFIGINSAKHFLDKGWMVLIFDNFSRIGAKENIDWLKKQPISKHLKILKADIRYNLDVLGNLVSQADAVLHLAAQVAVTTSVQNPREDFEINALGTLNVLEAIRKSKNKPILIYSSTNKVYGAMEDLKIKKIDNKYRYQDLYYGIDENRILDFHSPYGCSKGSADQYIRDYGRIYGLKTVVLRQSCIYGPHQFGIEDQGWVAWFSIASILDKPLIIYGDGKQVRDVLFVDDLCVAYFLVIKNITKTAGHIYNIGGGYQNQLSLLELIGILEELFHKKINYQFQDWRPGDQPIFVSDIRKATEHFKWEPKIFANDGIKKLAKWVEENKKILKKFCS